MNLQYQEIRTKAQENALNEYYAIISFKVDGTVKYANKKFLDLFGYSEDEVIGKHHRIFCDDNYTKSDSYKRFWVDLVDSNVQAGEFKRIKKDGSPVFIQASYKPLLTESGEVFEVLKFAQDITEKKLEDLNYSGQIKAINKSQAVVEFDLNGNILDANKIFLECMDYEKNEIIGKHHSIFLDEDYKESKQYKEFWDNLRAGKFQSDKFLRYGKNAKKVWIQATYTPILDMDGKPTKVVKFAQDVTELETVKKDALTGFNTRSKLMLDIKHSEYNNLAIIDIDDFSLINDFYGYEIGDRVIKKFSEKLSQIFGKGFILYRLYADKFAVLNNESQHFVFLTYLTNMINKITDISLNVDSKTITFKTSCGVSFEDNETIFNTAEMINKYVKNQSHSIMVYTKDLGIEEAHEKNIMWTQKIKDAIKNDRILLHYQAIYNNKTQKVDKYEALVRLKDEEGKIISPFFFLDIAKKSKQYLDITKIVIKKACQRFENEDYEFSINLTVEDIVDYDLKDYLFETIKKHKVAKKIVLELVESEKIVSYEPIYEFIEEAKALGCKIAIDDFGSGYSNFEYLVRINADYVKIDGSIIKRILEDDNSLEIVKSIISFASKAGIKTIAEFISSQELLDKVSDLGIDYSQGFHICKPKDVLDT